MATLALVTNSSWNILNFRKRLIQDLKQSYDVLLIAPDDSATGEINELAPVVYLKHLERRGVNPYTDLRLMLELRRIYKQYAVDLALHFTIKPNIYGCIAASQLGIPSIAVVTGLGYTFLSRGLAATVAQRLYRYAFKRNSLTIFENPDDQKLFIESKLVPASNARLISGSGVDIDYYSPVEFAPSRRVFRFVFIGRLLYDKGVRELFQAFREEFGEDKEVFLDILGAIDRQNPSAFSEAELGSVLEQNQNIIYHGHKPDVRPWIANSDTVVLPSYREGLPMALLEALAMSKPVIATDVPGCREAVRHEENGFLADVKSVPSLRSAMRRMKNLTHEQRKVIGQKGRIMAEEKFSSRIVNQDIISEIDRLLK